MRKIFITVLIALASVWLSFNNFVYAESENNIDSGYFDDKANKYQIKGNSSFKPRGDIIDNNLKTYHQLGLNHFVEILLSESINISSWYINCNPPGLNIYFYDENNALIRSYERKETSYNFETLYNVKKIRITGVDSLVLTNLHEFEIFENKYTYLPILSLSANVFYDRVILSWLNPDAVGFKAVEVYENEVYRQTVYAPSNTAEITNLKPETQYTFKATAIYEDGGNSEPQIITIKTEKEPIIEDVKNVKVKATHERVDLSWQLPESEVFKHVNIYRDKVEKELVLETFLFGKKAYAATKIFETNGTYFNDLTVQPESTYEYLLTTSSKFGQESNGITVLVETPLEPLPEIVGGGYEKDENGDYLYTWKQPTTGKVKILIDGTEYRVVEASTMQILIPKEDMKYDIFKNPKVTLIPITEDGKEGKPSNPAAGGGLGDAELPFGPSELLKSSFGLLGVLGPFILLVLAIYLVPKIKNVIVAAVQKQRNERRM